jgi:hypothetical protein
MQKAKPTAASLSAFYNILLEPERFLGFEKI